MTKARIDPDPESHILEVGIRLAVSEFRRMRISGGRGTARLGEWMQKIDHVDQEKEKKGAVGKTDLRGGCWDIESFRQCNDTWMLSAGLETMWPRGAED